ncbi:MAG: hypothetical protein QM757_15135 [Paludibaculum sp.]
MWFQLGRSDKQHLLFIGFSRFFAKRHLLFFVFGREVQRPRVGSPAGDFQPFQALKGALERRWVLSKEVEVEGEVGAGFQFEAVQMVAAQGEGA